MKKMIYAVKRGRKTGIFNEWLKCFEQTNKYPNAKFRRFEYRSELEREAEDVPGSLRYAIKEAETYLQDLVYLGESADYLEDVNWEKDGFLPFGDEPETEEQELFSDSEDADLEEDDSFFFDDELETEERRLLPWKLEEKNTEDHEEEYGEWLADSRDIPDVPTGYWTIAKEMEQYIRIIRGKQNDKDAKIAAAAKLKFELKKCLSDVNLNKLTAIYRDKEKENVLGYDAIAVSSFVAQMLYTYPKPKLSEFQEVEEKVSIRQIFMEAGAVETELKQRVFGQDAAIERLSEAYFNAELKARLTPDRIGPRNAYLLAGPPGVGKTFMAQLFAYKLGIPFKRFDMSGYSNKEAIQELVGFASTWKDSQPGILTEFVLKNQKCVLLFDEIEKADIDVIRLFLQILDAGICEDKYSKRDVSFRNTIIFFTTNAGRQLYLNARNKNLAMLSEKVLIDALEKDKDPRTEQQYFPPEILSRMSSYTVIMLNHLKADKIFELVEKSIENHLKKLKNTYDYELNQGKEDLARTVLYSMGGSADARNASKIADKLIDREIRKLLELLENKQKLDENDEGIKIEWKCDLEDATEEIKDFYLGERDCVIPVFGTVEYEPVEKIKNNNVRVKNTVDIKEFMEMLHKERVLFAVIDYLYGLENVESGLSIVDARTMGRDIFLKLREVDKEIPVYILDGSQGYDYTETEKNALMKKGVGGFIEREYFRSQLEQTYLNVCCQVVMETLTARHQVLTYNTKKEFDEETNVGSIIFCDFKLETAVESEDQSSLLSDDLRPHKSWDDIYVSEDLKKEMEFFIHYLQNPKKYNKKGVKPRGILLYGPPGTGKTLLAKVAASESGLNFLSISASQLLNEGPGKVEDEFRIARKYAPAILFIDEIDALGMERGYSNLPNPTLNALLIEMDGFKKVEDKPVFVIAATNHGDKIDSALQRRFDRTFDMGYLDKTGRRWILEKNIKKQSDMFDLSDEELENIVVRSERLCPAKLEQVVEAALREGIRSDRVIDDDLFDEIFEKYNMGEEMVNISQKWKEKTAYHEAGHALISLYYGGAPSYMSIVARGNHGGYMQPGIEETYPSKEHLLERICMALGGRAAELVFKYGLTSGASSDLNMATKVATWMVCELGMYEKEIGLGVIGKEELKHNEKANELINRILSEQMKEAISIIEANQDAMKRLVDAVMKNGKRYLTGKEIRETAGELNKK
ncbi:MAG: AAA family ATPase [Lachnospiraceae bacterium]|nr:AAA family ATPase [Lachnospiraceae bacterium]